MLIGPNLALTNRTLRKGGGVSFTEEATALFARMEATGVSPSAQRQTNINECIKAIKAAGVWTKLDYLRVYSAETQAHALLNWVADAINATLVGTPAFTANEGFVCSAGSGNYINSGFNPGASTLKYLRNDAHYGLWSRTNADANVFDMGQRTTNIVANANIKLRNDAGGGLTATINEDTTAITVANASSLGHYVVRRSGASATAVFKNGSSLATGTGASSAIPSRVWYEGTLNSNGAVTTAPTRQYAATHAGANLSDAEVAGLYAALNTFFTAIMDEVI